MDAAKKLKQLRASHHLLRHAIVRLQDYVRAYSQARLFLGEFEQQFLNYCDLQNKGFYSELQEDCSGDRKKLKMAEFLLYDLKDLRIEYLAFIEKHPTLTNRSGAQSFPLDFTAVSSRILIRLQMEEEYLFPLLEGLKDNP